jgi:hypothetical protein
MACITPSGIRATLPTASVQLSKDAIAAGQSANILDRAGERGPGMLKVETKTRTIGQTSNCKINIQGSMDYDDWYNVAYGAINNPDTMLTATITIPADGTQYYVLHANQPWRYLRLDLNAITNMQVSAEVYI